MSRLMEYLSNLNPRIAEQNKEEVKSMKEWTKTFMEKLLAENAALKLENDRLKTEAKEAQERLDKIKVGVLNFMDTIPPYVNNAIANQ